MNGREAGMMVGNIAVFAAVIAVAVWLGRRMGKTRGGRFVWWPTLVAVLLVVGVGLGRMARAHG